jgi:hypothetical protein
MRIGGKADKSEDKRRQSAEGGIAKGEDRKEREKQSEKEGRAQRESYSNALRRQ